MLCAPPPLQPLVLSRVDARQGAGKQGELDVLVGRRVVVERRCAQELEHQRWVFAPPCRSWRPARAALISHPCDVTLLPSAAKERDASASSAASTERRQGSPAPLVSRRQPDRPCSLPPAAGLDRAGRWREAGRLVACWPQAAPPSRAGAPIHRAQAQSRLATVCHRSLPPVVVSIGPGETSSNRGVGGGATRLWLCGVLYVQQAALYVPNSPRAHLDSDQIE